MSVIVSDVNEVINQLNQGNVIALPTETVYGLAADATNHDAVAKIYKIKNRPLNHPLIMHVAPEWDLTQWVETIPEYALQLIKTLWPGPLTLIFKLKKEANISRLITANQDTIAIRAPAHQKALEVLTKLGKPIVAPSANPFGKISPTSAQHVLQDFPLESFVILDGGKCEVGIESTIISCLDARHCSILRHGIINQSHIQNYCDILDSASLTETIKVSGNLKSHYQPHKPLFYFEKLDFAKINQKAIDLEKSYIISFAQSIEGLLAEKLNYTFPECQERAAHEFYQQLRIADQTNKEVILIELPPKTPEWAALLDRIQKAGQIL